MSTTSASPIVLILGAGPNIGKHVSRAFIAKGYKVALTSRSSKPEDSSSASADQIHIASDLSDPSAVSSVFEKVKGALGLPSVVVYNGKLCCYPYGGDGEGGLLTDTPGHEAAAATMNEPMDPLSLRVQDFARDLSINTTSAFAAAQQAALAFAQLPASASKTFIYTGNALNTMTLPPLMSLGVGKSAMAHVIQSAVAAYKEKGFK